MNYSDLNQIDNLQFIPVDANKKPIPTGWQKTAKKYNFNNVPSVGLVCGKLSADENGAHLEAIDLDIKYDLSGKLFERYKRLINEIDKDLLRKLVVQKTKNGGYHFIYRCIKVEGNLKLANRPTTKAEKEQTYKETVEAETKKNIDRKKKKENELTKEQIEQIASNAAKNDKVRVLIETRGEGGQIVCFPTPGYEIIYGDYYSINEITPEQRETLINIARQFNEFYDEVKPTVSESKKYKGVTPFEDYNERGDTVQLLEKHGWKQVGRKGNYTLLLRPGQTTAAKSGDYNHESKWFSVFTTSTQFEPQKAYLPYAVFAILECGGNYSEASKKLYDLGFGDRIEKQKEVNQKTPSKISLIDNDFSFLATSEDYGKYLEQAKSGTLPMGLTTGMPSLDKHFLFKPGSFNIINGFDNVGKALALDTPLPTPCGWTTMGGIKVGDELFDDQGKVCTVTFATPVQYDKKCYKVIFSNGEEIVCCEDHLWSVKTMGKTTKVLSVKQMVEKGIKTTYEQKTLSNYTIDLPKPINMPSRCNFIITPYTLGVWLGDGTNSANVVWSGEDDVEEMAAHIQEDGYSTKISRKSGYKCPAIKIVDAFFVTRLRCLNLYRNKHIPKEYLRASIQERISLLQGLMDTDGYVSKEGRLEFCTKNKTLADGFTELLSTLGLKYSLQKKVPSINGKKMNYTAYYVSFSCAIDTFTVFRLKRKIDRMSATRARGTSIQIVGIQEVPSVPVRCIQVDSQNHLFLCGRTMIPTHNTSVILFLAMLSAIYHNWVWLMFCAENSVGSCMRKLMEFYWNMPLRKMNDLQYKIAKEFAESHFKFIKSEDDLYNYKDILQMTKKMVSRGRFNAVLIDPYNALKIELTNSSKLSTHEYHYEAISEMKQYTKNSGICFYINTHAVTYASRLKAEDKKTTPAPQKGDVEGGIKFSNKADEFITIHRDVQHPTDWMVTELHIRKVKETETGGKATPKDEPVKIRMMKGGCAFCEDGIGIEESPIEKWHRSNKPKQSILPDFDAPYSNSYLDSLGEDDKPF